MNPRLLALSFALVLTPVGCDDDSASTDGNAGTAADGGIDAAAGTGTGTGQVVDEEGTGAEGTGGESGGPDIGEGVAWPEKSAEQRAAYMQVEVVPAISELWQQSPHPDATVTCVTCHGPGAAEGNFTMPNPALPPLDPTNEFEAHQGSAEWLQFMNTLLTPQMTDLLDAEAFNPETGEGFGCFSCHTMAG